MFKPAGNYMKTIQRDAIPHSTNNNALRSIYSLPTLITMVTVVIVEFENTGII